jgi:hypothetical protein
LFHKTKPMMFAKPSLGKGTSGIWVGVTLGVTVGVIVGVDVEVAVGLGVEVFVDVGILDGGNVAVDIGAAK